MVELSSEKVKILGVNTDRLRISIDSARVLGQKLLYLADEAKDHDSEEILSIVDDNDYLTMDIMISPQMRNYYHKELP